MQAVQVFESINLSKSKAMNKNKGKEEEIRQKVKCDCRQCRRAGPVENFMVYCPIHDCGRSTGLRMCEYFIEKKRCSTR
uniref:Uncharacterized protein n=1 Tax=Siphoviridae sp. ctYJD4 TaxID=2826375 RepID=A0A8S5N0A4_9CAUD|nr:MAG TPA: hypothetical protein [Siphoviridae sp. ctYJD4]